MPFVFTNPATNALANLQDLTFGGTTKVRRQVSAIDLLTKISLNQIDPGLFNPQAPATTGPAAPPPAPTTPVDLLLSILAIPIAHEGQPITSEYHNSLRDAIRALAGHMGANAVGQVATQTLAPAFLPIEGITPWRLGVGIATQPRDAQAWAGWFPVQLPDGSSIEGVAVIGRRAGGFKLFQVRLLRQALAGSDPADARYELTTTTLVTLDLSNAAADFTAPGAVNVSGLSAGAVEEFKVVDNTKYKYLIHALVERGDGQLSQINAVQVHCRVA